MAWDVYLFGGEAVKAGRVFRSFTVDCLEHFAGFGNVFLSSGWGRGDALSVVSTRSPLSIQISNTRWLLVSRSALLPKRMGWRWATVYKSIFRLD